MYTEKPPNTGYPHFESILRQTEVVERLQMRLQYGVIHKDCRSARVLGDDLPDLCQILRRRRLLDYHARISVVHIARESRVKSLTVLLLAESQILPRPHGA